MNEIFTYMKSNVFGIRVVVTVALTLVALLSVFAYSATAVSADDGDDSKAISIITCDINASSQEVVFGDTLTVTWNTSGFDEVVINGQVEGPNGSITINNFTETTTFTLSATNADGAECTATVTVVCLVPPPICDFFTANPQTIEEGGSATLSWGTTNAVTVTIDNGVGQVDPDGSVTVSPTEQTIYMLTAENSEGVKTTCATTVTVEPPQSDLRCDSFSASPDVVNAGEGSLLSWQVTGADLVTINNGIGAVTEIGFREVNPVVTTTYVLTAYSGSDSVTCSETVVVISVPDAPVCDFFNASPQAIEVGDSTTLSWGTTDATAVSINNGIGSQPVDGSVTVSPAVNTTYVLTATGPGGEDSCSVSVVVTETPPPPTPVCDFFNANPSDITRGEDVTLAWGTTNATNVFINNGIGSRPVDGSVVVSPVQSTTYILTAFGAGTSVSCQVTVTVQDVPPPPPTCDFFNATPVTITLGQNTTLSWGTTNATAVSINNGIGSRPVDGSITVSPTESTTYILTAFGAGTSVSCQTVVTVNVPPPLPVCDSFTAVPSTIVAGESVELAWETTNATGVSINNGIGSQPVDGSVTVSPTADTTYILTVIGANTSVTCQASVTVQIPPPTCDSFTATPTSITRGQTVDLTWETTNATGVSINNDIGSQPVDGSITVSPTENTTYILTAIGANTSVTCQAVVTVDDVPPPTCDSFTATPARIFAGEDVVLEWETTNATGVSINNGIGTVAVDGSVTVNPVLSTVYVLTANGSGTSVSCEAVVDVNILTPEPICDAFSATPSTINLGEDVLLEWSTSNASRVVINNGIGQVVDVDGSVTVSPLVSTTYTLTASDGQGRSDTCQTTVTVTTDDVPVCVAFTATPENLPLGGGTVVLDWEVADATTVNISPTVGSVSLIGTTSLPVTQSTTFTLTAQDADGDEVSCVAPVTVPDPAPFSCQNNVDFDASPNSISRGGNATLTWDVTDADSVSISVINATSFSGSETVSPSSDTTYVLTATQGDETIECRTSVDVSGGGGGGGSSSPRCELDISDELISLGDEVTLTWETRRARDITITDDEGNIVVTTEDKLASDKEDLLDGSITLSPTRNTEYTLVATRGSRDRTCRVEVELDDELTIIESRNQAPLVAGISLTSVPHTGFEAGPVMTVLFYLLLIAWAAYIAYFFVTRKEPVAGVSDGQSNTPAQPESNPEPTNETVVPAVAVEQTPHATEDTVAPGNLPVADVQIGYGDTQVTEAVVAEIEDRAHARKALLSSDAIRHFMATTHGSDNQKEVLEDVITEAKKTYPLEDGWIVINELRMKSLCQVCQEQAEEAPTDFAPTLVPEGSSSLAEAIVTGNVGAAYEMIGRRPMFSLADAAADLDDVYRNRRGEDKAISALLAKETAALSDEQIKNMIAALTSALDGTYTDEASAVKMAIMKAVKELG